MTHITHTFYGWGDGAMGQLINNSANKMLPYSKVREATRHKENLIESIREQISRNRTTGQSSDASLRNPTHGMLSQPRVVLKNSHTIDLQSQKRGRNHEVIKSITQFLGKDVVDLPRRERWENIAKREYTHIKEQFREPIDIYKVIPREWNHSRSRRRDSGHSKMSDAKEDSGELTITSSKTPILSESREKIRLRTRHKRQQASMDKRSIKLSQTIKLPTVKKNSRINLQPLHSTEQDRESPSICQNQEEEGTLSEWSSSLTPWTTDKNLKFFQNNAKGPAQY